MNLNDLAKFEYSSVSHAFNRAVIAAYNNASRLGYSLHPKMISVVQNQQITRFILDPAVHPEELVDIVREHEANFPGRTRQKKVLVSEHPRGFGKWSNSKEIIYVLDDVFADPNSRVRRGISFTDRRKVKIVDNDNLHTRSIFDAWVKMKLDDGVHRISFNPNRYLRSFALAEYGFNIYNKLVLLDDRPYAVINLFRDRGQSRL